MNEINNTTTVAPERKKRRGCLIIALVAILLGLAVLMCAAGLSIFGSTAGKASGDTSAIMTQAVQTAFADIMLSKPAPTTTAIPTSSPDYSATAAVQTASAQPPTIAATVAPAVQSDSGLCTVQMDAVGLGMPPVFLNVKGSGANLVCLSLLSMRDEMAGQIDLAMVDTGLSSPQ